MQYKWLHQNNNRKIILFFNGWGMDENPFLFLESNSFDVLMFYNYSNLDLDTNIKILLKDYREYYLLAWSMGVWVAFNLVNDFNIDFSQRLALNGSLLPIDENYGIKPLIYDATLNHFSKENRDKFFNRMFNSKKEFEIFMTNKPNRSLKSQKEELSFWKEELLKRKIKISELNNPFNQVLMGKKDKIIPYMAQNRFWEHFLSSIKSKQIDCGHFMFYQFQKWDDFLS